MIKRIDIRTSITLLCTLFLGSIASGQPPAGSYNEMWRDPAMANSLLGSYGYNGDLEPKVPQEETLLFKEVLDLFQIDPKLALQTLEPQITRDSSAPLYFFLAILQVQQDQMDKSIANLRISVAKRPNYLKANQKLGLFLATTGKFKEAIPFLTKTIELGGPDSMTYGLLGLSFLNQEQYISAEAAYSQAFVFDPFNDDWKKGLIQSLMSQRKYTEAIALLEEMLIANPEDDKLLGLQANAYVAQNMYPKAVANYEIIDRIGKSTDDTLTLLGDLYMEDNVPDLALNAYLSALDKGAELDVTSSIRTAKILADRGALDESSIYIAKVNQLTGDDINDDDKLELLKLESRIAIGKGNQDKAMGILEQIVERDPLDGDALLMLALSYRGKEEYARATLFFERAQKVSETEVKALIGQAQMLIRQRQYIKAVPLLEKAQDIEPRDYVARYLQEVRLVRDAQRY
jgi:tetratricopeptide (TPR) repeat protein